MPPQSALIVGASRGLGLALVKHYASTIPPSNVYATVRGHVSSDTFPKGVNVIQDVDLSKEDCGRKIVNGLQGAAVQIVVYVAGVLKPESLEKLDWEGQVLMYKVCSIAPVFVIKELLFASSLSPDAKVALLTSEGGSIALRTEAEGGGMFGHHGSKAAGNMVGHLLSYDLKQRGIPIVMIHPGFLKTEMTKNAGFEQFYDQFGAITPDEAAKPFADFVNQLEPSQSGKHWAPLGGKGIGNAEEVLGKEAADKSGPLEIPW
ncbi:cytoplasmic protein [Cryptococcus wingfieldii CBS 7118]|uniref:Cytoplasmic protein n=1 Tax=Cryptococcus wingfieldii CBS 7118 TaxID=1295528 RepID=A0A1E3IUG4_9TREE|nr:cytoplasmic protein [Cryptococcus wingfieldii CBS 7118]ODN92085.1 cytoplasmic protein [Cryptococcus wingfieldii CBS 7118]